MDKETLIKLLEGFGACNIDDLRAMGTIQEIFVFASQKIDNLTWFSREINSLACDGMNTRRPHMWH